MRERRRWTVLVGGLVILASLMVGGANTRAGVVTGNPGGSLAGQIPVSAAVDPYATLAWTDCLYGLLAPLSGGGCNSTLNVASNTDISLRLVASPLTNGAGRRLLSSYTVTPSGGSALTLNPDTGQTAQVFQVGAPLDTLRAYAIHGTATNDQASTIAGSYTGQIQVTVVAASTDLTAPTGVTATAGDTQLTVTWNAVPGATGYEVGYHLGTTWNAGAATVVSASGTSKVLTGLANFQTYMVAVRSVIGSSKSGWSAAVQGIPAPPAPVLLYRDARDFGNVMTALAPQWSYSNICSPSTDTGATRTYAAASCITHGGYTESGTMSLSTAATTTPSVLPNNTRLMYHVWVYVKSPQNPCCQPTYHVTNATNSNTDLSLTLPTSVPSNAFQWVHLGTLAIANTDQLKVWAPNTGYTQVVRGVVLTTGTATPTCTPTGNGGDRTTC